MPELLLLVFVLVGFYAITAGFTSVVNAGVVMYSVIGWWGSRTENASTSAVTTSLKRQHA